MAENRPRVRRAGLVSTELDDEVVIYDGDHNVACRLNRPAALVWQLSDGTRTTAELAELVGRELGVDADEQLVLLSLDQLAEHGLIESGHDAPDADRASENRRRFMRRAGIATGAAFALPAVSGIGIPAAIASVSVVAPAPPPSHPPPTAPPPSAPPPPPPAPAPPPSG